ncbi:MAG: restriction endonuclease subunit S [Akkermansia muciniphila]|nr:restriction endonuclease subunit S [Akkermansia muciniphila]
MSWQKVPLSTLCSAIIDCVNKTAPLSFEKTPYKMLRTSNIRNGRIDTEDVKYVSRETYEKWTRRCQLLPEDIIFTREAPLGEVGMVVEPEGFFLGQRLVLFRTNPEVCYPKYLLYVLQDYEVKNTIVSGGVGSTVTHMRVPECAQIQIPCPPLEIQKRIADTLYTYDTLIENNRKQIKLLEEAARRLYKEWFVDLRFPGHEHTPIVNGIPEGWRRGTLHDMADMVFGQSPKSDYYNKRGMGLPFHQGVASYGDRFVVDSVYTTKYSKAANPGSILFSVRAPVGRLNITRKQIAIGRGIAALNHKNGAQSFLYYLLKDYFHKEDIVGNGAIFASVSGDELRRFPIILPSDETIDRFNAVAKCYDEKIEIVNKQNELLTEARDRLLPKLMSGEIAIK